MKKNVKSGKNCISILRRDNRGSAIVLVIIAMAMIGVLASTILWSAYINYMIKCADVRNKNSFYSAETVMEQIMAGMQHEASAAVSVSYNYVMKNWNNDENESTRFNTFTVNYLDTLVNNLKDPLLGSGYYDRSVLQSYIDSGLLANMDMTVWSSGDHKMEIINNSTLVLYDISVSYTDENDYVSIINTDLCIDVPKLVFYQAGSIDNLYEYSLIGNAGIETKSGSGSSVIDGSIYGGVDKFHKTGGISVNSASSLTVKDGRLVISGGDINVNGPSAGLIVRDVSDFGAKVYATSLNVNSGTLSLDSQTYVANDLILSGTGSRVTLTKEYYGYGNSTKTGIPTESDNTVEADNSSAILINGRSATIDMSGITKLLIAGRAYIGQYRTESNVIGDAYRSQPVMMGESIAVKGDQIAYLVPAECIGVLDGKTTIGQNPLNGDLALTMTNKLNDAALNGTDFKEVDFDKPIYKLGNKTLRDFGVTDMTHIRKVYAQYVSTDPKNQLLLYYYLVMDKDNASKYFVQYYDFNANKEALDKYFNKYASGGIILGDYDAENTQYTILGNSIVSDAITGSPTMYTGVTQSLSTGTGYQEISENAEEMNNLWSETEALNMSAEFTDVYKALTTNLSEDASSVGTGQDVFNSIILENTLRQYFADHPELGNTIVFTTADGLKAVLTQETTYTIPSSDYRNIRLVVAIDRDSNKDNGIDGGNVVVNNNFTGLIIAEGKITVGSNVSLKRDKMDVYKVLNAPHDTLLAGSGNPLTPLHFFVNGVKDDGTLGALGGEVTGESKVDESGTLDINLSQIVRYSNWIKR